THLCYSEFNVVVGAIDALNADVTSIESARSRGEILEALEPGAFPRGIGPGVWDIHSPRVPGTEEIADQLRRARAVVAADRLWVNPDCGLKTRGYAETEASLRHLVAATREVRAEAETPVGVRSAPPPAGPAHRRGRGRRGWRSAPDRGTPRRSPVPRLPHDSSPRRQPRPQRVLLGHRRPRLRRPRHHGGHLRPGRAHRSAGAVLHRAPRPRGRLVHRSCGLRRARATPARSRRP